MAVKIAETLWYQDPVTGALDRSAVDPHRARESVSQQMGKEPFTYGWLEISDGMGVEEKTARHRVRQLACSEYNSSNVNSCWHVYWHDITNDVLLPSSIPFEKAPEGARPVLFESPRIGNRNWERGNLVRQQRWGHDGGVQGGRGNIRKTHE